MNFLTGLGLLVLAVGAAVVAWFIGGFNRLVKSKALVDEGKSGIDVQLKRRWDLIPNLVATVKQYATHEKGVFEEVTKMRSAAMNAGTTAESAKAEAGLSGALKTLFAVSENYPELKANQNFLSLQQDLGKIEDEIQLSRRYYNGAARNYNVLVQHIPTRFVAQLAGFHQAEYFEIPEGAAAERTAPKVDFKK